MTKQIRVMKVVKPPKCYRTSSNDVEIAVLLKEVEVSRLDFPFQTKKAVDYDNTIAPLSCCF